MKKWHHRIVSKNLLPAFVIYFFNVLLFFGTSLLGAQNFLPGFSQHKIAGINYPTAMAMAPDGRIFCTEKDGKVKVIKNGEVLVTPFLEVAVQSDGERGLVGIVLEPGFSGINQYVYIYYTTAGNPVRNRLSRFTANGDVAVPGSETLIMEFEPLENDRHCGGGMAFGDDGKLYVGVGNDNVNSHSQDLNSYKGKVLRINKDGSVPAGNPFTGSEAASRIWAFGLRNPWTIAVQPGTGKIFVNDVGEISWEEINDCSLAGRNFGWPSAEGNSGNPTFINPVYTYPHGSGSSAGCAISGGDFFNPVASNYPAQFTGKYFFTDYCNNWINYLDLSSGVVMNHFASDLPSSCNYIKTGMDGNLYYFSIGQNALYKIVYGAPPALVRERQDEAISFSIFPNPTGGKFFLEICEYTGTKNVNAEIFNLSGQAVYKEALTFNGCTREAIELGDNIFQGIYILRLTSGDRVEFCKLVIGGNE